MHILSIGISYKAHWLSAHIGNPKQNKKQAFNDYLLWPINEVMSLRWFRSRAEWVPYMSHANKSGTHNATDAIKTLHNTWWSYARIINELKHNCQTKICSKGSHKTNHASKSDRPKDLHDHLSVINYSNARTNRVLNWNTRGKEIHTSWFMILSSHQGSTNIYIIYNIINWYGEKQKKKKNLVDPTFNHVTKTWRHSWTHGLTWHKKINRSDVNKCIEFHRC